MPSEPAADRTPAVLAPPARKWRRQRGARLASPFLAALGPPGLLADTARLNVLFVAVDRGGEHTSFELHDHWSDPRKNNILAVAPALAGIPRQLVQLLPSGWKDFRP